MVSIKDVAYGFMTIVLLVGIAGIAYFIFSTQATKSYTTLAFEKPDAIPKVMLSGTEYTIPFTIYNHENQEMTYLYRVQYDGMTKQKTLLTSSIQLQHGQEVTIPLTLKTEKEYNTTKPAKFTIELVDKKKEIHFWVQEI